MGPYAPTPPPGAQPAPLWGDEQHVRSLLGERVADVSATLGTLQVTAFGSGEELRDDFKSHYGPTIAVYAFLGDGAGRVAALDRALVELAEGAKVGGEGFRLEWEYLLLTATRS